MSSNASDSSSDEDEVETSIGEGEEIEASSSSEEEEEDDESSKTPAAVKKPVTEKQVSDSESGSEEDSESDSEPEKEDEVVTTPVKPATTEKQVSDSDQEDSESESEPEKKDEVVTSPVKPATTEKQVSESGSEEDSESDSEPEKEDEVVITEIKDSVLKNQDSKKVKTCEKSVAKRSRETDEAAPTDVKRAKKVSGEEEKKSGGGEETKKSYFQRVWSEDDEIAVLQGLIDYKNDTGESPYGDRNGVYQLVKKTISFAVTKIQFMEKLRSLKKKYENNVAKAKNGKESTFVKPHDRKTFELSKFIWGASGMALESAVKSNGKPKKSRKSKKLESAKQELGCEDEVTVKGEVSSLVKSLARFGVDELAAQQGFSALASEDKKRLEEQWKALQVKELDFYSQKSGFLYEVMTKIAEAFRSNR